MKLVRNRYVLRQNRKGLWTVYDGMSGFPATTEGKELINLSATQAHDTAVSLNAAALMSGEKTTLNDRRRQSR
jgi:hypothetical protein